MNKKDQKHAKFQMERHIQDVSGGRQGASQNGFRKV
jgi:hypothetical protein